jgi:hypothetical protein
MRPRWLIRHDPQQVDGQREHADAGDPVHEPAAPPADGATGSASRAVAVA